MATIGAKDLAADKPIRKLRTAYRFFGTSTE
jgi:hypothetical protein